MLPFIAGTTGRNDIGKRMRTAFCYWCNMIHGKALEFFAAIHTAMPIMLFNHVPLGRGEVIERRIPHAGASGAGVDLGFFAMLSAVLSTIHLDFFWMLASPEQIQLLQSLSVQLIIFARTLIDLFTLGRMVLPSLGAQFFSMGFVMLFVVRDSFGPVCRSIRCSVGQGFLMMGRMPRLRLGKVFLAMRRMIGLSGGGNLLTFQHFARTGICKPFLTMLRLIGAYVGTNTFSVFTIVRLLGRSLFRHGQSPHLIACPHKWGATATCMRDRFSRKGATLSLAVHIGHYSIQMPYFLGGHCYATF